MTPHQERDLTEIREALAALLDLAALHVPVNCAIGPECGPCSRHRAIIKRARGALALLTPATLLPLSEPEPVMPTVPTRYRITGNHYEGRECVIIERVSGSYYMVAMSDVQDGEFHQRADIVTMSVDCLREVSS